MSAIKTLVITGGNTGLGLEAIKQLTRTTQHGQWDIILSGRNPKALTSAVSSLRDAPGSASVEGLALDLVDRASTSAFAAKVGDMLGPRRRIDVLCLNAGVANSIRKMPPGSEWTEETLINAINTSNLLEDLLPLLQRPGADKTPSRVVFLGSNTHFNVSKDTDEVIRTLKGQQEPYVGLTSYASSKWATTAVMQYWRDRLSSTSAGEGEAHVQVFAVSPGFVPTTGLARGIPWYRRFFLSYVLPWISSYVVSVPEGGSRVVEALTVASDDVPPDGDAKAYLSVRRWIATEPRTLEPELWKVVVPQAVART